MGLGTSYNNIIMVFCFVQNFTVMILFMLFSVLLGKLISTTSDKTARGETVYRVQVIKTFKVKKFDIRIVCLREKELV
jgi:hypothetical protein